VVLHVAVLTIAKLNSELDHVTAEKNEIPQDI